MTSGSDGVLRNVPEPTVEPEGMVRSEEARTDVCEEPAVNEDEEADPPRKKRKLPIKSRRGMAHVQSDLGGGTRSTFLPAVLCE